jgi:hypothetical protein
MWEFSRYLKHVAVEGTANILSMVIKVKIKAPIVAYATLRHCPKSHADSSK